MIAFQSEADFTRKRGTPQNRVYLYDSAQAAFTLLTNQAAGDSYEASISEGGDRVAFTSTGDLTGQGTTGLPEIFIHTAGAGIVRLTDTSGAARGSRMPAISGNGMAVVFLSDGDFSGENPDGSDEVFLFLAVEGSISQISDDQNDDPSAHAKEVAIDRDGSHIAFVKALGGDALFLHESGGPTTTLIDNGLASSPSLSADGSMLAFLSNGDAAGQNADGNAELFLYQGTRRGGMLSQITVTTTGQTMSVAASRDGSRLLFLSNSDQLVENTDGNAELFVYVRSEARFAQLTDHAGPVLFAGIALNESGRRVVFSQDPSGTAELYFAGLPGSFFTSLPLWPAPLNVLDLTDFACR